MKLTCTLFTTAFILTVLNQAGMWQTWSFVLGVTHPLLGMDHIIVMMAVGLWAVMVSGRALWVFPLTFLATMLESPSVFAWLDRSDKSPFAQSVDSRR